VSGKHWLVLWSSIFVSYVHRCNRYGSQDRSQWSWWCYGLSFYSQCSTATSYVLSISTAVLVLVEIFDCISEHMIFFLFGSVVQFFCIDYCLSSHQCCCLWPWSLALACFRGQILSPWPWPWRSRSWFWLWSWAKVLGLDQPGPWPCKARVSGG